MLKKIIWVLSFYFTTSWYKINVKRMNFSLKVKECSKNHTNFISTIRKYSRQCSDDCSLRSTFENRLQMYIIFDHWRHGVFLLYLTISLNVCFMSEVVTAQRDSSVMMRLCDKPSRHLGCESDLLIGQFALHG